MAEEACAVGVGEGVVGSVGSARVAIWQQPFAVRREIWSEWGVAARAFCNPGAGGVGDILQRGRQRKEGFWGN